MNNLTERAFAKALKDIMQDKSFDKVTVTELVKKLNVNRQTFYYHFNDLYDLLERIYIMDGDTILNQAANSGTWQEELLAIFHYIQDNRQFVCNTYYSVNRNYLEHFLYDRIYRFINPIVQEKHPNLSGTELDCRVNFYKYALVGFVLDWIDSGLKENPEALAQHISRVLEQYN
ncbi:TetR/AcrR family transcriptional regulator [Streptococcus alactolyticus]|uniref:TetR family transcriptional regulator n=2 Tax=Streptococcus TaxID=1301 RepID=A0A6N7WPW4_STRAY|nr:TetR/AcrR family transcriptional regulator [Streptococcus alactolyticus]MST53885.1 TetR family transcriptional regulator [Streptococcus alactolyticus]